MGLTRNEVIIVTLLLTGTFLVTLNQNLLSPALATIMVDLSVGETTVQYVMSAYALVEAIIIPLSAFFLGKFTIRQLFNTGMILFTAGSLLAALSPAFVFLLLGRILQAIAAGCFIPMTMTLIMTIFPRENRGTGMGLVMLVCGFGPALGPVISGYLVDSIGWRMLFILVTIVGVRIVICGIILMKNYGEFKRTGLDVISIIYSTIGLVCVLYGFSSFSSAANIALPLVLIVVGIVFIILFGHRQLKLTTPMLNIRVLAVRNYLIAAMIGLICIGTLTAMGTLLPLYLQNARGFSALDSGLVMFPGALLGACVGMVAGRMYDKLGARKTLFPGVLIFMIGAVAGFFYDMSTTLVVAAVIYGFVIVGIQFTTTPMNTWGINALETHMIQHATAVSNTLNQVGASFLTAVVISVSAFGPMLAPNGTAAEQAFQGDHLAFIAIAVLGVIALLLILIFVRAAPKKASAEEAGAPAGQGEHDELTPGSDPMHLPVSAVMHADPYRLESSATERDAATGMLDYHTSGLPIVDADMKVVGFISDGDIMKYIGRTTNVLSNTGMIFSESNDADFSQRIHDLVTMNVMKIATDNVLTVDGDTMLEDACTLLGEKKIKKVPVVEGGKLVGTLSRNDVIRRTMAGMIVADEQGQKALAEAQPSEGGGE